MPEFRFWGNVDPRGRVKPAILAAVPPTQVEEGVGTLRIYDPIDSWGEFWGVSARELVEALDALGDVERIDLHLNSPGGEVYEAIAILNALRQHPARVVAMVDGIAASAASFIAAGVDELVMGQNTDLMIHDAWGIAIGPAALMRDTAERLDHISDNIASIYAGKAGGTVPEWRERMLAETWLSADQAVESGLADSVVGAPAQDEDAAAARFDLTLYRNRRTPPAAPEVGDASSDTSRVDEDRARRFAARRHRHAGERHGLAVVAGR